MGFPTSHQPRFYANTNFLKMESAARFHYYSARNEAHLRIFILRYTNVLIIIIIIIKSAQ